MGAPAIEARGISKRFGGTQALANVDLDIARGEVHCLAGENGSGKSTFVKVISGVHRPDHGSISILGRHYPRLTPLRAIQAGVQVIYQDMALFPTLSVADNLTVNRLVHQHRFLIHRVEQRRFAEEQLARLGVDLDLDARVDSLSTANQQVVAIARAIGLEANVLFMDEPTAALTAWEVQRLLSLVDALREAGLTIVFISHKLGELFDIADRITVFRNGQVVGTFPALELDEGTLSFHMTGHRVSYGRYTRTSTETKPILRARDLTATGYERVDLEIRPGDIVGLTGLLGSGRTELALTLFGLNHAQRGTIEVDGRPRLIRSPRQALEAGIALLPENRQRQGLFMRAAISANLSATILDQLANRLGLVDTTREAMVVDESASRMGLHQPDLGLPASSLSGGNQQKVVIGKWVATTPRLLILDSPTVGVDVGSKAQIYERIRQLASTTGLGVLLISEEIEELLATCNRVLVMSRGTITQQFDEEALASADVRRRIRSAMEGERADGPVPVP